MAKKQDIVAVEIPVVTPEQVQQMIKEIRGEKVILDNDLAKLYGVETKVLNQAVRRNLERFPADFMFQLTDRERNMISWSQIVTLENKQGRNIKYAPYAFTEGGVAMLSGILRSPIAIKVNIQIMRAFVYMKNAVLAINQSSLRQDKLELEISGLKSYVEDILRDQNDINEEMNAQMEAINQSLIELNVQVEALKGKPKPTCRPIGYEAIKDDYKTNN